MAERFRPGWRTRAEHLEFPEESREKILRFLEKHAGRKLSDEERQSCVFQIESAVGLYKAHSDDRFNYRSDKPQRELDASALQKIAELSQELAETLESVSPSVESRLRRIGGLDPRHVEEMVDRLHQIRIQAEHAAHRTEAESDQPGQKRKVAEYLLVDGLFSVWLEATGQSITRNSEPSLCHCSEFVEMVVRLAGLKVGIEYVFRQVYDSRRQTGALKPR